MTAPHIINAQHKSARAWAADLVDAWLDNDKEASAAILQRIDDTTRPLAQTTARLMCERVAFWARWLMQVDGRTVSDIPLKKMQPHVRRFRKARGFE